MVCYARITRKSVQSCTTAYATYTVYIRVRCTCNMGPCSMLYGTHVCIVFVYAASSCVVFAPNKCASARVRKHLRVARRERHTHAPASNVREFVCGPRTAFSDVVGIDSRARARHMRTAIWRVSVSARWLGCGLAGTRNVSCKRQTRAHKWRASGLDDGAFTIHPVRCVMRRSHGNLIFIPFPPCRCLVHSRSFSFTPALARFPCRVPWHFSRPYSVLCRCAGCHKRHAATATGCRRVPTSTLTI